MDKATTSVSSSRNGEETGLEQVLSDLKALKKLYGLLRKGPADENLDETSRALLMKMLDDATQQALLKQAKLLSGSLMSPALDRKLSVRSDRRTPDADEPPLSLKPPASPSPSLLAGERSSQLNMQDSTLSRRAGGHVVDGNRQAAEETLLARLASYRSSRTTASALPPRHHRPGGDHRSSGLSLYRLPVPAPTSQHGTVTRDRTRRTSGRGDPPSPEGSSRRRSVSRLHGRGTGRHVGAESSSAARRLGRLGSGVSSQSKVSRRGSERPGRGGVATPPEQSSSSNTVATIRSRIRPNQEHYKERCLSPSEEEEEEGERTPRRGRTDASISSSGSHDRSSSLEGSSSRRSSVSRELSLGQARWHGRGTTRRVGEEGSYSKRRLGRMSSRLSQGLASRRGSERAGRGGVASRGRSSAGSSCSRLPRRTLKRIDSGSKYVSSSSGAAVSCPSTSRTVSPESSASASYSPPPVSQRGTADSRLPVTPRGAAHSRPPPVSPRGTAHSRQPPVSPRGTAYSRPPPVSPRGTAYTRPPPVLPRGTAYTRPPPVSQWGTAYSPPPPVSQWGWGTAYSPPAPVSHRGIAWPLHAPQVSRSMRQRRRQEILQKRVERLRILKNKIAMVFYHHHHHYGRGQEGPSSCRIPREHQIKSPWQYLGGIFHHTRGRDTKTASRALVEAPAKKRGGGGGNVLALFDAMRRHLQSKRRTTASVKMRRMANRSRVRAKKMHWWQQLATRRGRAAEVTVSG